MSKQTVLSICLGTDVPDLSGYRLTTLFVVFHVSLDAVSHDSELPLRRIQRKVKFQSVLILQTNSQLLNPAVLFLWI